MQSSVSVTALWWQTKVSDEPVHYQTNYTYIGNSVISEGTSNILHTLRNDDQTELTKMGFGAKGRLLETTKDSMGGGVNNEVGLLRLRRGS